MRIIAPSDYVVMPWKNGQGRTTQMYILPKQNLISEFDVRISVAHVGGSGPFSLFPGIDRILVQLTGSPMTVRHPGESGRIQLRHFEPYRFPGELETEATLEGEASDFNVMTRRGVFLADVNVHRMQARQEEFLTFGSDLTLLWAATGAFVLYAPEKQSAGTRLPLGHCAVMNEGSASTTSLRLQNQNDDAVLLEVKLRRAN